MKMLKKVGCFLIVLYECLFCGIFNENFKNNFLKHPELVKSQILHHILQIMIIDFLPIRFSTLDAVVRRFISMLRLCACKWLQVIDLFKEIKQTLAECLFCLASQRPLNKAETLRLVVHLQTDISLQADQTMDPVSLCLLMTLLSCFDTSPLEHGDAGTDLNGEAEFIKKCVECESS